MSMRVGCRSDAADGNAFRNWGLSRRRAAATQGSDPRQARGNDASPPRSTPASTSGHAGRHAGKIYLALKWIVAIIAISGTILLVGTHCAPVSRGGRPRRASSSRRSCDNGSGVGLTRGGADAARRRTASSSRPRIFVTASHLRRGTSDGDMRLRIVEHNLRMLFSDDDHEGGGPIKSVIVFSTDDDEGGGGSGRETAAAAVEEWRRRPSLRGMITDILFAQNDAILVDASKWTRALRDLLPEIERTDARVVLLNDSFLLMRNVPELWDDAGACGGAGVCGLAWTHPPSDPARHVQSYLRSLSSCEVSNYVRFYEESKDRVRNVNELIELFEMNLGWANEGAVSAIYEYAGGHPDQEAAQKVLIPLGYPAIKLKKFFVTNDPWLSEDESSRSRLPPAFSAEVYERMNHDLNHLSRAELEEHFATFGRHEDRIYSSSRPLVMKGWMRAELTKSSPREEEGKEGDDSTMRILEDYLASLNAALAREAR